MISVNLAGLEQMATATGSELISVWQNDKAVKATLSDVLVLTDNVTGTKYRLSVDEGILSLEEV